MPSRLLGNKWKYIYIYKTQHTHTGVFCAVTLCSLTFNPTAGGNITLCIADIQIQDCTLSEPQTPQTESKTEVPVKYKEDVNLPGMPLSSFQVASVCPAKVLSAAQISSLPGSFSLEFHPFSLEQFAVSTQPASPAQSPVLPSQPSVSQSSKSTYTLAYYTLILSPNTFLMHYLVSQRIKCLLTLTSLCVPILNSEWLRAGRLWFNSQWGNKPPDITARSAAVLIQLHIQWIQGLLSWNS